jgi:hypothetical protein
MKEYRITWNNPDEVIVKAQNKEELFEMIEACKPVIDSNLEIVEIRDQSKVLFTTAIKEDFTNN